MANYFLEKSQIHKHVKYVKYGSLKKWWRPSQIRKHIKYVKYGAVNIVGDFLKYVNTSNTLNLPNTFWAILSYSVPYLEQPETLIEWKFESMTYGRTDQQTDRLTWVGARDTCVSKMWLPGSLMAHCCVKSSGRSYYRWKKVSSIWWPWWGLTLLSTPSRAAPAFPWQACQPGTTRFLTMFS